MTRRQLPYLLDYPVQHLDMVTDREKYQELINQMPQGFCLIEVLFDEAQQPVDFRFLEVNDSFEGQTGLVDATGKTIRQLQPGYEQYGLDRYGQVVKTGQSVHFEQQATQVAGGAWYDVFAFPFGDTNTHQVAILFQDITQQKCAQDALHQNQQQQSFLLRLSDALRPLVDTVQIQKTVTQLALDQFQADRCYYTEMQEGQVIIRWDVTWTNQPSGTGVYPLTSMPIVKSVIESNQPLIVHNVYTSDRIDESLHHWCIQGQTISFLALPVFNEGRAVGVFWVEQNTPRQWTTFEAALAQEIAERTWTAIERARVEEALRSSEKRSLIQKEAFQAAINGEPLASCLKTLNQIVNLELGNQVRTAFYLAYPDGTRLHAIEGAGTMPQTYTAPLDGFPVSDSSFCSGYAIATGRPSHTRDVFQDSHWQPYLHLVTAHQFRACSSYPILTQQGKAIGSFAMYFPDVHEPVVPEFILADAITQAAAIILSRHTEALERECSQEALRRSETRYRQLSAELEERVNTRTQALTRANEDLKRSNDNLQQFAYVASHDLQEPLRKIQAFSTLLEEQLDDQLNAEAKDHLHRITAAGARMSTLIKDLLAYSRIATRQQVFGQVSLAAIVAEVLATLEWTISQSGAQIQLDELPLVNGDPSQLGQLVQNLLSNALKFVASGQSPCIYIGYSQRSLEALPVGVCPGLKTPQYHQIDIADNGIGFDESYTSRIFQVFQRLHGRNEYAGTGVGLAICQRVVENHGGAITVNSHPGQGSTFSVYLPA